MTETKAAEFEQPRETGRSTEQNDTHETNYEHDNDMEIISRANEWKSMCIYGVCVCVWEQEIFSLQCVRQDTGHLQWLASVYMAGDGEVLLPDRLELNTAI